MKRQLFGLMSIGLSVGLVAGCVENPTESLSGTVAKVISSVSFTQLTVGDSIRVEARAVDAQGNSTATLPTVASSDESVVTVSVDETVSGKPLPETVFFIKAVGAGEAQVTMTSGGASGVINAISFPAVFTGAVSVDQSGRLDVVTIAATSAVAFDPMSTSVWIDGGATRPLSITASEVQVMALSNGSLSGATVTLNNLLFLGSTPIATLDAATTVDIRGEPDEPANNSPATATVIAPGGIAAGSLGGTDASDFYAVTVPADGTLDIMLAFVGSGGGSDPDIDIILYDASGAVVDVAFTTSQPESISTAVTAGTYFIEANLYDGHGSPEPYWYELSVAVN